MRVTASSTNNDVTASPRKAYQYRAMVGSFTRKESSRLIGRPLCKYHMYARKLIKVGAVSDTQNAGRC